MTDSNAWESSEQVTGYDPPVKHNIAYNLWNLGNIPMLVRCSYHGSLTSIGRVCFYLSFF